MAVGVGLAGAGVSSGLINAARGVLGGLGTAAPSQQMIDWYQQYAAEHPNSKAAPYWAAGAGSVGAGSAGAGALDGLGGLGGLRGIARELIGRLPALQPRPVPAYLSGMNSIVEAMNAINNGSTDPRYQQVIDRYKADPNLLLSEVSQIDRAVADARQRLAQDPNDFWANTMVNTFGPQQQHSDMLRRFNDAFQQWQANPGYGTSWQQTANPWEGMAQWLRHGETGQHRTGGGNFGPARYGGIPERQKGFNDPGWNGGWIGSGIGGSQPLFDRDQLWHGRTDGDFNPKPWDVRAFQSTPGASGFGGAKGLHGLSQGKLA